MVILVCWDRDGTVNVDNDYFLGKSSDWRKQLRIIHLVIPAMKRLQETFPDLQHHVITNQSGVGRGYFSSQDLTAMHQKMRALLNKHHGKIDKIYYCPHTPHDNCTCRKPETGMFEQVADDYKIDLPSAINIGDSLRDLQAGQLMGCQNILVKTGKGTKTFKELEKPNNIKVFANLSKAVDYILNIS